MGIGSRIKWGLRNLFHKQKTESQLGEEVRAYVEMVTDARIEAGLSADEARRTVLAEFGGVEQVKQAVRDHRAGTGFEILWQDARFGLRQLRRNPGFTTTAILTLGLGIGAITSIFTLVHAVMHVLKNMLLDGIEAVLFAQWINKRDLRRVRPDLREQVQVDRVYSFGIPLYEAMDRLDVGGRSGILLGSNTC
jgi:hypothetical protein